MEFARCLMLSSIKRRHMGDSSWEEKAFAEDAAGVVLGGIVWPPRSYSCSFCHREFRSAQALGGHMNVHRRDRARLKQSLIIPTPNPSLPRVSTAVDPKKDGIDEKKYVPSSLCHKGPSDCPSNSSDVIERISKEQNSTMSSKRSKTSGSNSLSSFRLGPYSSTHSCSLQSDAVGLRLTSIEELDLELRLGDTPKVK